MQVRHFPKLSFSAFALILFFQASPALAAATLMGVVRENQLGGNMVSNVSVSALGANPVKTGRDGQFVLHFPQRQPGEDVSIDVSRNGWVVVNDIQLKRSLPANAAQSPLEILIARAAERERWALQFYRLQGERAVDARYKKKLAAADSDERARLLRERDQARAQADELARQLATRPAGSGGEDYQKAAALFLDGRMDEALEILSEERLRQQEEDIKKRQEDALYSWLLRGQLLAVKFDFEGAARAYGEAVRFAPASYDAWFGYSLFHQKQLHFQKSREGYNKALALAGAAGRNENVAMILNNLGFLHSNENRMAEALIAYENALKIRRKLARQNPDVYLPDVAGTLNNLGVLHHAKNRMPEARVAFEESLTLYRKLAQQNLDAYLPDVAMTLNNLGILHNDENRMPDALAAYEESLKLYRKLVQWNSDNYLPYVAGTLNNLGVLHNDEKHTAEARAAFEESLKIRRKLAQQNPDVYLPDVAGTLNNLGNLHRAENRMAEALVAYDEALRLYRKLAQQNSDVYLPYVATVLNNLGSLRGDQKLMAEAQAAYEESLEIRRKLAQKNPDVYLPYVAKVLNNLGSLHRNENRIAEAGADYEESLKIYRTFAKGAPAVYEPYVRTVQRNLDELSSDTQRKP